MLLQKVISKQSYKPIQFFGKFWNIYWYIFENYFLVERIESIYYLKVYLFLERVANHSKYM